MSETQESKARVQACMFIDAVSAKIGLYASNLPEDCVTKALHRFFFVTYAVHEPLSLLLKPYSIGSISSSHGATSVSM